MTKRTSEMEGAEVFLRRRHREGAPLHKKVQLCPSLIMNYILYPSYDTTLVCKQRKSFLDSVCF